VLAGGAGSAVVHIGQVTSPGPADGPLIDF